MQTVFFKKLILEGKDVLLYFRERVFLRFDFVTKIAQDGVTARLDRSEDIVRLDISLLDDLVSCFFRRLKGLSDQLFFRADAFQS